MTVVALCSAKGAPGVTTLACLLGAVWPVDRPVVVAECDPSGGDIAARFDCDEQAGMAAFVLAARHHHAQHVTSVASYVQQLPGGLEVLVGASNVDAAHMVDQEVAGMSALTGISSDVVADCGRVGVGSPGQQALLVQADVVVVVTRGDRSSLGHAGALLGRLAEMGSSSLGLVVTGSHHGEARSAARALRVDLAAAAPWDAAAAAVVRGEPGSRRRLVRSPLVLAAEALRRWVDSQVAHARRVPGAGIGSGTAVAPGLLGPSAVAEHPAAPHLPVSYPRAAHPAPPGPPVEHPLAEHLGGRGYR